MNDLRGMFGFLPTYDETLFAQKGYDGTLWIVDCSLMILDSDVFMAASPDDSSPTVALREYLFQVGSLALAQGMANN